MEKMSINDWLPVIVIVTLLLAYHILPITGIAGIENVIILFPCLLPIYWFLNGDLSIEWTKRMLKNPDKNIRLQAVKTLRTMNIQKFTGAINISSLQLLLKACDDESNEVRHLAISVLHDKIMAPIDVNAGSKTSPTIPVKEKLDVILKHRIVNTCNRGLNDSFPPIRKEATSILRSLGCLSHAIPLFIKNLAHFDPAVQEESAKALGRTKASQATPPLIKALGDDEPSVRIQAARALQFVGESQAFHPLMTLLEDQNPEVQKEARNTLKVICSSFDTVMFGKWTERRISQKTLLYNPDIFTLAPPMPSLKQIVIHSETYNVYQVERFLTYALNAMGQKYFKKRIEVHVYGEIGKLQPNLRNNLVNFCKHVHIHPDSDQK